MGIKDAFAPFLHPDAKVEVAFGDEITVTVTLPDGQVLTLELASFATDNPNARPLTPEEEVQVLKRLKKH